jgi:hypothetical protein
MDTAEGRGMSESKFNVKASVVGSTWNHWEIMWGDCKHGVKTVENGERLPDPPCPYCRIATLEKVAEAAEELARDCIAPGYKSFHAALRAAGYLKDQSE